MLHKLARTMALVAVGIVLLHGLPGFCDEVNDVGITTGMTRSDGCVASEACCASASFVQNDTDVSLGALEATPAGPTFELVASQSGIDRGLTLQTYESPLSLSSLGKLTI